MSIVTADVVVVGGTSAGCAAAIMAARLGCTVALLEPTPSLGGMSANGVPTFEDGTPQALCGLAEEFGARVKAHYARRGRSEPKIDQGFWEPHVAAEVWHDFVKDTGGIEVLLRAVPVEVITDDGIIREIVFEDAATPMGDPQPEPASRPRRARGRLFVDATNEGDVAAWAGASFRLGREARSRDEPHAGVIHTLPHGSDFVAGYPPQSILPGSTGAADDRLCFYNVRLHCRFHEDSPSGAPHRLRAPPPGYDPGNYRWTPADPQSTRGLTGLNAIPGGKYYLNRLPFGNDLVAPTRPYILASPRDRAALRRRFVDHALGFLYFIQSNGNADLGLVQDEFPESPGIPYRVYVREGRRVEGHALLTEADINPFIRGFGPRPPHRPDAIAIGDWPIEMKPVHDRPTDGAPYPEGALFLTAARAPFQIPYGCLVPRGVRNLLVACAVSATHVAYNAVRCEANAFHHGMAAGVAAGLACQLGCEPIEVPIDELQQVMNAHRGKTSYFADLPSDHPHFEGVQWAALRGWVPDDPRFRCRPEAPATWGDLVEATVACLAVPISVTGAHFEGLEPADRAFRYAESLYDLESRSGSTVLMSLTRAELHPYREHIRPAPRNRWLALDPGSSVTRGAANAVIAAALAALDGSRVGTTGGTTDHRPITRGELCTALRSAVSTSLERPRPETTSAHNA